MVGQLFELIILLYNYNIIIKLLLLNCLNLNSKFKSLPFYHFYSIFLYG